MKITHHSTLTPPIPVRTASEVAAKFPSLAGAGARAAFDGIICFGGQDWWYHNRGHYDLQLMRELSAVAPVLYINSIGLRVPSLREGGASLRRYARKWQSLRRGIVEVRPGMSVYSPLALPARVGRRLLQRLLALQVRRAARSLGIQHPLVWVACPPACDVLDLLRPHGLIYQRTDRYEEYPGVDRQRILHYDRTLKARANITLFCSSLVYDEERAQCREPLFVDHGVDYGMFEKAGDKIDGCPELADVPRPRAGYVGNLEPHRVDHPLLAQVAQALPEMTFVIVGPGTLSAALAARPNVRHFGQQPYEKVAAFMSACDVLLMPWNDNAWIRACNPVKLKEYLAVGRPVVTTPFDELRRYDGVVTIAANATAFADAIQRVVQAPPDVRRLRARVQSETWEAKATLVLDALRSQGICPGTEDRERRGRDGAERKES